MISTDTNLDFAASLDHCNWFIWSCAPLLSFSSIGLQQGTLTTLMTLALSLLFDQTSCDPFLAVSRKSHGSILGLSFRAYTILSLSFSWLIARLNDKNPWTTWVAVCMYVVILISLFSQWAIILRGRTRSLKRQIELKWWRSLSSFNERVLRTHDYKSHFFWKADYSWK